MDVELYKSVVEPVESELSEFKRHFHGLFVTNDSFVRPLLDMLSRKEGKMLRPLLVLLTGKYFGFPTTRLYNLASSLELLHTSSLIHDDIVDNSMLRRGEPSVNAVYDNKIAVLLGDYVVAMSLSEMYATGVVRNFGFFSELSRTLSSGEITQLFIRSAEDLSEESYLDIITRKTACLFSCCARLASITCGASDELSDQFASFGKYAGICFQIKDDIFDYFDSPETGKPSGNDLSEGKITLPAIYAIRNSSDDWSQMVRDIRSCTATPDQLRTVAAFTVENGGIEYAEDCMMQYKEKALACLPSDMPSGLRKAFESYLLLIVNRNS